MIETWFLLFGGSSVDGRSNGSHCGPYEGRTTDRVVAQKHYREMRRNPYSIGEVRIITDDSVRVATDEDFGVVSRSVGADRGAVMTPPTTEQITALEQWAKREHDYATEIGFGTDYTSVNKLRDVLALCAAWREGQEDNLTLQLIIDGVNHDMRCDDGSCLRCQRDAAVARAEQAERERDALMVRVDQWRQMADREATACVEMRAERDAARAERDAARAALQAVEWADMERRCPWCLAYADDNIGHKAYYQRQAALGMGEGQ